MCWLAVPYVDLIGLAGYKQATDFHLINLVAEHGGVLVTFNGKIAPSLAVADQRFVQALS